MESELESRNLAGQNLTGRELSGADLRWANLSGVDLSRASLKGGFQHQPAITFHPNLGSKEITADFLGEHCSSRWTGRSFDRGDDVHGCGEGQRAFYFLRSTADKTSGCCLAPGSPLASQLDVAG